ncbi:unnamed protein product [Caenorhabditis nigoni]
MSQGNGMYSTEDDWFLYTETDEFKRPGRSPGAVGAYYEPGNIDNIPLAEEPLLSTGQGLEFDLAGPIDDYGYDQLGQQSSTSQGNGMLMDDWFSYTETDEFNRPGRSPGAGGARVTTEDMMIISQLMAEINTLKNYEQNGYDRKEDIAILEVQIAHLFSKGLTQSSNDLADNTFLKKIQSVSGNGAPSTQQQQQQQQKSMNSGQQIQQPPPPPKFKPKKRTYPKKKPQAHSETTVGSLLTKANKLSQQENNNENQAMTVEARVTIEDMMIISQLMNEINTLKNNEQNGYDHKEDIATLEAQIAHLFSKGLTQSSSNESAETILIQIQS